MVRGLQYWLVLTLIGCAHNKPSTPGPWTIIESDEAREKFIMIQQASGSLSQKQLYYNIQILSEMYPNEDLITITKAGIYGDFGQSMSAEKEKAYKEKAVEILKPFTQKEYDSPIDPIRVIALNQYYYHSGQYKKQYDFGHQVNRLGGKGGDVLIAIGGSMLALELDRQGKLIESNRLAREISQTWKYIYGGLEHPMMKEAAYQNNYFISSLALAGQCGQAKTLFKSHLQKSRRFNEMQRWYGQFNPDNIKSCQSPRQLSSKK